MEYDDLILDSQCEATAAASAFCAYTRYLVEDGQGSDLEYEIFFKVLSDMADRPKYKNPTAIDKFIDAAFKHATRKNYETIKINT